MLKTNQFNEICHIFVPTEEDKLGRLTCFQAQTCQRTQILHVKCVLKRGLQVANHVVVGARYNDVVHINQKDCDPLAVR